MFPAMALERLARIKGNRRVVLERLTKPTLARIAAASRTVKNPDTDEGFTSRGSTVTKKGLEAIANNLGISVGFSKVNLAKRIAKELGFPWKAQYSSEGALSGGGSTVTKDFYVEVLERLCRRKNL